LGFHALKETEKKQNAWRGFIRKGELQGKNDVQKPLGDKRKQ